MFYAIDAILLAGKRPGESLHMTFLQAFRRFGLIPCTGLALVAILGSLQAGFGGHGNDYRLDLDGFNGGFSRWLFNANFLMKKTVRPETWAYAPRYGLGHLGQPC